MRSDCQIFSRAISNNNLGDNIQISSLKPIASFFIKQIFSVAFISFKNSKDICLASADSHRTDISHTICTCKPDDLRYCFENQLFAFIS